MRVGWVGAGSGAAAQARGEGGQGVPMAECLSRVRQARKKKVQSGDRATVAPGGDGFACPASGCKSVFDTAAKIGRYSAIPSRRNPIGFRFGKTTERSRWAVRPRWWPDSADGGIAQMYTAFSLGRRPLFTPPSNSGPTRCREWRLGRCSSIGRGWGAHLFFAKAAVLLISKVSHLSALGVTLHLHLPPSPPRPNATRAGRACSG